MEMLSNSCTHPLILTPWQGQCSLFMRRDKPHAVRGSLSEGCITLSISCMRGGVGLGSLLIMIVSFRQGERDENGCKSSHWRPSEGGGQWKKQKQSLLLPSPTGHVSALSA